MKKFFILFILILILIPVILFFVKNGNNSQQKITNVNSSVDSPDQKVGFLVPEQISFPNGFSFAKAMNAKEDIGKNALYYDYNPIALDGTEWVATKKISSESEYEKTMKDFDTFYNTKIYKNGWSMEQLVDKHNLQPLSADSALGSINGYLKYASGSAQVILFYNQKDSVSYPANIQFRIFLSDITSLSQIAK